MINRYQRALRVLRQLHSSAIRSCKPEGGGFMSGYKEERVVTLFEHLGCDSADMATLAMGAPGRSALSKCAQIMKTATAIKMKESEDSEDARFMQYGAPAGDPQFLDQLASFLSAEYGDTVNRDSLVVTGGATSGLVFALNLLFPDKCRVYCEESTYHIAIRVFHSLSFPISSVPIDSNGMDTGALDEALSRDLQGVEENRFGFKGIVYAIPTFHNPTGVNLSPDRCKELIRLARNHRVLVICDDVYNTLWRDEDSKPPPRLLAWDLKDTDGYVGSVLSNGTFSKILSPGLRLGWIEGPEWFVKHWKSCAILDSGGCLNMYTCSIVSAALQEGLVSRHLQDTRNDHKARFDEVATILKECVGDICEFEIPKGGFFLWIKLPRKVDATLLLQECMRRHNIQFHEGFRFVPEEKNRDKYRGHIRIAITYLEAERLGPTIRRLCKVIGEINSST